jgi:hypothetical protein
VIRGRPPVEVEERMDAVLSVRMTDAEYAAVLAQAAAARTSLGEYVRDRLFSVYNKSGSRHFVAD